MDKITHILNLIKNKKNKLEGQRINKKWFINRGLLDEWNFLEEHNIKDAKSLYMFVNNESDKCKCGSEKRFISFKDGFKEYCEKCARTSYNNMKKHYNFKYDESDVNFKTRSQLQQDIKKLKVKDKYSSSKILANPKLIQQVINSTFYLSKNVKIAERLYHIENSIKKVQVCKNCGCSLDNFISSKVGYYSVYCKKNGCALKFRDYSKISKNIRHTLYTKMIKKFKNILDNLPDSEDYIYTLFTEEEYVSNKGTVNIKHKCGHEYNIDLNYQGHFKCPKCYPIRSKKQYEISVFLEKYVKTKFNDRQFIKPLELDILTENFAVEYDSLSFHSTGNSTLSYLNSKLETPSKHLRKTELCESKDIQLFRIFSNEWSQKQDIWKSVLLNKLRVSKRVFARKCVIKEISSVESREFLEQNHLQGSINSSIKIGLYYDRRLVQVMTFGKTRFSKKYQYELLRMCTLLNTTVVGGASKLLKYFERTYKPKSIVSYANRRWSKGNVYEKLGFQFSHDSDPNYFYFKGDDNAKLFSRNQFQKHLLKDKLKIFDPELTESENMYNNGYRKIYDCGNKVYVKNFS